MTYIELKTELECRVPEWFELIEVRNLEVEVMDSFNQHLPTYPMLKALSLAMLDWDLEE